MKYSPVVIFAYNRPIHLLNLLNSLSTNPEIKHTDSYIFIDGNKDKVELENNLKTVKVAEQEWKFKSKTIIHREANYGLKKNIINGLSQISKKYDNFIVLEDDLIVSSYFLHYMNYCLIEYENHHTFQHVNGYNYKNYLLKSNNIYQSSILFPWGWGTWSKYWNSFTSNPNNFLINKMKNLDSKSIKDFNFYNLSSLINQLEKNERKEIETWAVYWYQFVYLNRGSALTPGKSFTKNFGFDGSGQHSGNNQMFNTNFSSNNKYNFKKIENKYNLNLAVSINWHFKQKLSERWKYHILKRINKK